MVARAVTAPLVIGVDVGGTKILAGLVDREGHVLAEHRVATPDDSQEDALAAMDEAVRELLDDRVAAIGYGIPANLERGTSRILQATNMLLAGVDLVARSRERFGLPVGVENDGNVAALAEWKRGAGRDASNLVMLTLGTGVGGGVVIDDRLFRGWAELGHIVVQENGPPCPCGGRGHLEALASGQAADAVARGLYGDDADARVLVDRARAGEGPALEALTRLGATLGAAIGSLVNTFDPELVVIGGGFGMDAAELVIESGSRGGPSRGDASGRRDAADRSRRARRRGRPRRRGARRVRRARRDPLMPLAVCATPIGNLDDVTLRVLAELREADVVLCEDTRRTRILLGRHGIDARLVSYHRHNEVAREPDVLERLGRGERVALVSDAGLPGVNDPGARLIRAAAESGLPVTVLPGASAVETALVASGVVADRYAVRRVPAPARRRAA